MFLRGGDVTDEHQKHDATADDDDTMVTPVQIMLVVIFLPCNIISSTCWEMMLQTLHRQCLVSYAAGDALKVCSELMQKEGTKA